MKKSKEPFNNFLELFQEIFYFFFILKTDKLAFPKNPLLVNSYDFISTSI
jgi:hypothetical protein